MQIILDTKPPGKGKILATGGGSQVTLNWTGFTDAISGIVGYRLVYGNGSPPKSCLNGTLINTFDSNTTSYLHTGLSNGETYYYRICAIDKAGNMSKGANAKAKLVLK